MKFIIYWLAYVLFVLLVSSLVCLGFEKILNIFRSDKNEM